MPRPRFRAPFLRHFALPDGLTRALRQARRHPSHALAAGAALVMMISLVAVGTLPASRRATPRAGGPASAPNNKRRPKAGELPERATATSTTRRNADGSLTTTVYGSPVNYRAGDGTYHRIDTSLHPDNTGGYAWKSGANAFTARFKPTLDTAYTEFTVAGQTYRTTAPGAATSTAQRSGTTVSYPGAYPGADLTYTVTATGVKEVIDLAGPTAPTSYTFQITAVGDARPLSATRRPDGSYRIQAAGSPAGGFTLAAPLVTETAGGPATAPAPAARPTMRVSARGRELRVTISLDAGWLRSGDRRFPVHLDPTMTVQPDDEDANYPATGSTVGSPGPNLYIGGDATTNWRSAVLFSPATPSLLPDDAMLTDAKLDLYYDGTCIVVKKQSCGAAAHTMDVYGMTANWMNGLSSDQLRFDATAAGSYTLPAGAGPGWMSWPITDVAKAWLTGTRPNYGLLVKRRTETLSSGGPAPVARSSTQPASLKPKLELTYTEEGSLLAPTTLHANGADLAWTPYTGVASGGAPFDRYEVHRSPGTADFTPTAGTLLASIGDQSVTSYRDTTAAPNSTFTYKLVTNGMASYPRTVTLPTAGQAHMVLQPGPTAEMGSEISSYTDPSCGPAAWAGTNITAVFHGLFHFDLRDVPQDAQVTSATATLWADDYPDYPGLTVEAHRVTRPWKQGTAPCAGPSWTQADAGQPWTTPGGDYDPAVEASVPIDLANAQSHYDFPIKNLVQSWVNGTRPNDGILLRAKDETLIGGPENGERIRFASNDTASAARRPKLDITYVDGVSAQGPGVSVSSPESGAVLGGTAVSLSAAASDDGHVTQVDFLVDGTKAGGTSAAPWQMSWNSTSVSDGNHSVSVRATDDAGNVTTSPAVSVTVDNAGPPSVALSAPPSTVTGTTTLSATASAAGSKTVSSVAFLVDGVRVGAPATSAPYQVTWSPQDWLAPTFNGSHQISAVATDSLGRTTTGTATTVTVDTTGATSSRAGFTLNDPADASDDAFPVSMGENTTTSTVQDPYATSDPADGSPNGGSLGRSLASPPVNDLGTPPGSCPVQAYCPTVNVTNTSGSTWTSSTAQVWYRWYAPNGAIMYEGRSSTAFPATFANNASQAFPLVINPPALPPGVAQGTFRLRIDVWDPATGTWFSARGNQPVDNSVIVAKALATKLGLERFYQYDGGSLGAGASNLVNVANGDLIARWSPFFATGRGLSTMTDLTYNSLEDHSSSPAGNNFSLSMSGLARLGEPIDIHPNKADQISGRSNKWIEVTDGDGTTHHFDGVTGADGITRWSEPAGVNLYLRAVGGGDPGRVWALTRPDKVTYYFDADGFPTVVEDRNLNTITYTYEDTPPGEDPGGPKKRIIKVTDAGGRDFTLAYWSKAEAKKAHVRGKIKTITDHSGGRLDFDYYDDGNLLRLTQVGGANADGTFLADRSIVFTYTTSKGDGPAIGVDGATGTAARLNPDPRTPNESTRLYSVIDPRAHETRYAYYQAVDGAQLRWKLKSRTDRDGQTTSYAYDLANRVTAVTAPLSRVTSYTYDTSGRVTSIVDPANLTTGVVWTADNKVTQVTYPNGKFATWTYNPNGYLLSQSDELSRTTVLTYLDSGVDVNDTGNHLSLLASVTKPNGTATGIAGDYQSSYTYDSAGNLDKVTDPTGAVTDYDYNLAGSANPGTVAAITAPNGTATGTAGDYMTTFTGYDPSGQPTRVVDPLGHVTTSGYDPDGNLLWLQDPNHASASGTDVRAYRAYFDYDSFGRLGRQSAPKSTTVERGNLLWSSVGYDANDNQVRKVAPHYGPATTDPGTGAVSTVAFDVMDRPTLLTGPHTSADPAGERTSVSYDAAGRTAKVTRPKGVQSSAVTDDYAVLYAYDVLDRVTRQTKYGTSTAQARVTQLCYDTAGDMRSVTSPRAGTGTITCPGNGAYTGSYTTQFDYDAAHQQIARRDALGHEQRTTYDPDGNVTAQEADITTGRVKRTEIDYDQRDKPIVQRERFDGATGRNATTRIEYDANGNRIRLISPRGSDAGGASGPYNYYVTVNDYDQANELTRSTLPYDSRDGAERQYQHRSYDANGNLLWSSLPVTQPDPNQVGDTAKTSMTYFDTGWIRTSDDPTNPAVHFDYTATGQQSQRTPEKKSSPGTLDTDKTMTWEFFPDQMLKTRKDQGGQPSTYTYDANNNLVSSLDTGGVTDPSEHAIDTQSTYTGFDEVAKTRHQKQGDAVWKFTDYTYDDNGNVTVRRENGQEDTAGTQSKAPRRYELTYDAADWLSQQLDLGTDSACKDDSRTVNTFWSTGLEKSRDTYRAGSACTSDPATWTRKQSTSWTHFDNGKLRTLTTTNGSGTVTESHNVSYTDSNGVYVDGNRTTDTYVLKRGSGSTATTCLSTSPCNAAWTYDARDRLISEQKRAGKTDTYTLDEPAKLIGDTTIRAGNLTTQVRNGITTTQRYTGNQLTDVTTGGVTGRYWYDEQGNTDCLTLAAGSQADCSPADGTAPTNLVTDYSYDYLNRTSSVRNYNGTGKTDESDYTYDALDRTSKQTEDHTGTGNDRTTTFTYQGLSSLVTEEKQSGGTNPKTKSYSYDNFGHKIGMTDTDNATGATNAYTYGNDVHGSISQLIDDAGTVKASYGYSAYGAADSTADSESLTAGDTNAQAPINPMRYSGKRSDSGTATSATAQPDYDMGARRYGPANGRFLQGDAFSDSLSDLGLALDPLTQNRYALAGGNPISYVETDGHMFVADGGGGGSTSPSPSSSITQVANDAGSALKGTVLNAWDDLRNKPYLAAADTINGTAGELYRENLEIMREQAKASMADSERFVQHYLKSGAKGIGPDLELNNRAYAKFLESSKYELKAGSLARGLGSKLPFVGAAITAAGIGIDIHNGKPKGKAIISGVGGALAAAGGAAATGALIGSVVPGAGTAVGFVAGAAVGTVTGLLASGALDYAYDHLSQNVQQGIESAADTVTNGISQGASDLANGVKDAWNSIF